MRGHPASTRLEQYPEGQVIRSRAVLDSSCRRDITSASPQTPRLWSPYEREEPTLVSGKSDPFTCMNEVDLFSDLTAEDIQAMDLMIPAARVRRGELLFSQAEPVDALFILKSGRVRIFRVTEDGKAITMAILGPGAVFGEMLQLGQRMYDNYAEAIEDSTVCRLSTADVERFLLTDPRIAIRVARLLGDEITRLEDRLTDLTFRPLIARCGSTLLKLAGPAPAARFGHGPVVRLTHEQLSGLLGATREATSKVMVELAAQGLIRQARGRITILNEDGLHQVARRNS